MLKLKKDFFRFGRAISLDNKQYVETVVYLSKLKSDEHVKVEVDMSEFEPTGSERRKLGTYEGIKKYILEKYGFKVPTLYISQIKRKVGVDLRPNYNPSKNEKWNCQ